MVTQQNWGPFLSPAREEAEGGAHRASRRQVSRPPTCCSPVFLQSCQGLLCPGRAAPRSSARVDPSF